MEDIFAQSIALAALAKASSGGGTTDAYTKDETDELLEGKADLENGKVPALQLPYNIWIGTSAQYSALVADDYDLYFIKEESV